MTASSSLVALSLSPLSELFEELARGVASPKNTLERVFIDRNFLFGFLYLLYALHTHMWGALLYVYCY